MYQQSLSASNKDSTADTTSDPVAALAEIAHRMITTRPKTAAVLANLVAGYKQP